MAAVIWRVEKGGLYILHLQHLKLRHDNDDQKQKHVCGVRTVMMYVVW